jgi:hypothetical protein
VRIHKPGSKNHGARGTVLFGPVTLSDWRTLLSYSVHVWCDRGTVRLLPVPLSVGLRVYARSPFVVWLVGRLVDWLTAL